MLEKLHNAFIDAGGEIRTARVTLVGGSHDALKRYTQRGLITQGLSSLGYNEINMPYNHWMHAPQQSIDYLFSENTVLFRHMINPEDESQDQHSPSLDTQEKELFFFPYFTTLIIKLARQFSMPSALDSAALSIYKPT